MKLSAYIVRIDSGFAPNPFGGLCTLTCCKPSVRRKAQRGDIIVGTGSARNGLSGKLIFAMRVGAVIPFQTYWERYPSKRPNARSPIGKRGDNIWHRDTSGVWRGVPGALHGPLQRDRDLSGENVVIADEFYYFGRQAIPVPNRFDSLIATTQGHKNIRDLALITRFWGWVSRVAPKRGRVGLPSEFTEVGCRAQRTDTGDDDILIDAREDNKPSASKSQAITRVRR